MSVQYLPPFVASRLSWRSKSTFTAFDDGILLSILRLFSSFLRSNSFFSRFFSSSCFIVAVFRPAKIGTYKTIRHFNFLHRAYLKCNGSSLTPEVL